MIRFTADTNVLISGSFWSGSSFKILEKADKKEIELVTSSGIIQEYSRVVNSDEIIEKIEDKSLILSNTVQRVILNSIIVEPREKIDAVKEDPDDNKILECAKAGQAEYIVTNDNHLLKLKEFEGIKIVKPEEFLRIC
jgi:uncharacterized protein